MYIYIFSIGVNCHIPYRYDAYRPWFTQESPSPVYSGDINNAAFYPEMYPCVNNKSDVLIWLLWDETMKTCKILECVWLIGSMQKNISIDNPFLTPWICINVIAERVCMCKHYFIFSDKYRKVNKNLRLKAHEIQLEMLEN